TAARRDLRCYHSSDCRAATGNPSHPDRARDCFRSAGYGFVTGLPRPGGSITGFMHGEATMAGKWLGLLKEIAPRVRRAAIMFNPDTAPRGGAYFLSPFEAAARSLAIDPITAPVRDDAEIGDSLAWARASRPRNHARRLHGSSSEDSHFVDSP